MHSAPPATISTRPNQLRHALVAGLLAAIAATVGSLWPTSSSSTTATSIEVPRNAYRAPAQPPGALGETDGAVPGGTTIFDDRVPAVANLNPALRMALRQAAGDAAVDGVRFVVNSGWRSAGYQQRLLQQAVAKYGSQHEAARWVATPAKSAHVSGNAVDIGPSHAASWLSQNGVRYGLCRIYGNEPWHYELRPDARAHGCPPVYADPSQDPRTQR